MVKARPCTRRANIDVPDLNLEVAYAAQDDRPAPGENGRNMVKRCDQRRTRKCVVCDLKPEVVQGLEKEAPGALPPTEFAQKLSKPRAVWLMVPRRPWLTHGPERAHSARAEHPHRGNSY